MSKLKNGIDLGDGNRIYMEDGVVRFVGNYSKAARCLLEEHLGAKEVKPQQDSSKPE